MLYSKSPHTESGRKAIAWFLMLLLFFVYAVEAMHHHKERHYEDYTRYSYVEYTPQCWICDQLQHQPHELIHPERIRIPATPIFDGIPKHIHYSFPLYQAAKSTAQNKDPPFPFSYSL